MDFAAHKDFKTMSIQMLQNTKEFENYNRSDLSTMIDGYDDRLVTVLGNNDYKWIADTLDVQDDMYYLEYHDDSDHEYPSMFEILKLCDIRLCRGK